MGKIAMAEAGTTQRRPCCGLGCGQGTRPQDKCEFMLPEELYSSNLACKHPKYRHLILQHPIWRHMFAPDGVLLREGDAIRNANLSRTLGLIAERGADVFYQGEIADAIISKIRAEGGIMTHEDLINYKVNVTRALEGTYRGLKVYTSHAPTSGPVLLHMLNLLENYDLPAEGRTEVNVHRLVEAMKCKPTGNSFCLS
jgi:gamma-glutamyltranspeptidase/glutathione hydrolase/leukotriene-C4 hydrolase